MVIIRKQDECKKDKDYGKLKQSLFLAKLICNKTRDMVI